MKESRVGYQASGTLRVRHMQPRVVASEPGGMIRCDARVNRKKKRGAPTRWGLSARLRFTSAPGIRPGRLGRGAQDVPTDLGTQRVTSWKNTVSSCTTSTFLPSFFIGRNAQSLIASTVATSKIG